MQLADDRLIFIDVPSAVVRALFVTTFYIIVFLSSAYISVSVFNRSNSIHFHAISRIPVYHVHHSRRPLGLLICLFNSRIKSTFCERFPT